jgi:hypothetical protein
MSYSLGTAVLDVYVIVSKGPTAPVLFFKFWCARLLALRPLLAHCASLG